MDMDLREMFEESFVTEPPPPPVHSAVVAGRKALRRRRVLSGAATAVVCIVAVLGASNINDSTRSQTLPVDEPKVETPAQVEARLTDALPVDDSWTSSCGNDGQPTCADYVLDAAPVGIRSDGSVVRISEDVVVAKRADDPAPAPYLQIVELEVRVPATGHSRWWVLTRKSNGTVSAAAADPRSVDFWTWANGINSGVKVEDAPPSTPARVIVGLIVD